MHTSSIRCALANTFQIPLRPSTTKTVFHNAVRTTPSVSLKPILNFPTTRATRLIPCSTAPFSTTASRPAKKRKGGRPDRRITLIRYFLHHPTTLQPRPLRFSRNRYLRHWTIHRAWSLYKAKMNQARERELERQYNAMHAANEELRLGAGDGGRLFRRAQMKTGVWSIPERGGGVPIEYSRGLVEWVGTTAMGGVGGAGADGEGEDRPGTKAKIWDSQWKRF